MRPLGGLAVPAALVIGTMAPDFPYYLPVSWPRSATHTLASVIWFSVPVGVATYYACDRLLCEPSVFLLPLAVRSRLRAAPPSALTLQNLLAVCVSVAVGALTHVIWDAFTHSDGAVVLAVPALQILVAQVGDYSLWLYKVLQHASTIGGLALLAYWLLGWIRRTPPSAEPRPAPFGDALRGRFLLGCVVAGPLIGLVRAWQHSPNLESVATWQHFAGYSALAGISVVGGLLILFSVAWHWRTGR